MNFDEDQIKAMESMDAISWGRYFDRDGRAMKFSAWVQKYERSDRRVALTETRFFRISTVYLGLNHALMGGPPLIYETMVFPRRKKGLGAWGDLVCDRYSTEQQALAGHEAVVRYWTGWRGAWKWFCITTGEKWEALVDWWKREKTV